VASTFLGRPADGPITDVIMEYRLSLHVVIVGSLVCCLTILALAWVSALVKRPTGRAHLAGDPRTAEVSVDDGRRWFDPEPPVVLTDHMNIMRPEHKILIVEDEPNVRLVFRTALESGDCRVSTAADGAAALACLSREKFDLVLLDLQMPGAGGMQVLARIREQGDDVPVIIISAHDEAPNVVRAMKLGAIDFLAKPLTPEALRGLVGDVLGRETGGGPTSEPDDPLGLLASARRALRHRLFHRAGVLLRQAIANDPDAAEAHYLLGVLSEVEGRPAAAADAYRAALRVDPNYQPARFHLMKYQSAC
jgi:CheY-like chemotaxis protein